jgi:hypothetical protein
MTGRNASDLQFQKRFGALNFTVGSTTINDRPFIRTMKISTAWSADKSWSYPGLKNA